MKIKSQDGKSLINFDFYDYQIRADKHIIAFSSTKEIFLGTYEDEDCSKEIIDKIVKAYNDKESVFNMP